MTALVARAGRYVQEYEKQFSALVYEEHQTQRIVRVTGTIRKQRELISDLVVVKAGDRMIAFRDVISVDGKAVRDRQERLQKLFLDQPRTAMQQARAIRKESARYNIGFDRNVDTLMVPLEILQPRSASRFRFTAATRDVAFEEVRSPSWIRSLTNGVTRDMLRRGFFTLESLLVPANTVERYVRTGKLQDDHVEVSSSYLNFRRFQVTLDERIDAPR